MKQNNIIRKINAAALLLLFLFGSTPKLFLHNIIANHKDEITVDKCASQTTVAKLPVYCHCDNIVIESPFLSDALQAEIVIVPVYTTLQYHHTDRYHSLHYSYCQLRGPPVFLSFAV